MSRRTSTKQRLSLQLSGEELAKFEEARELLGLNDGASTIRYLVQRGLESMSAQLASRRMIRRVEAEFTPQQMLPIFEALTKRADEEQRRVL